MESAPPSLDSHTLRRNSTSAKSSICDLTYLSFLGPTILPVHPDSYWTILHFSMHYFNAYSSRLDDESGRNFNGLLGKVRRYEQHQTG